MVAFCDGPKAFAQTLLSTIGGSGINGYLGDGSGAIIGEINFPKCVAVDGTGNIYVADYLNQRIRKINPSGIISTFAGTGSPGYSGDGSAATAAQITNPWGVATDAYGNVYFSDSTVVRKVSVAGIISTVAGTGTAGYSGDGGAATAATLSGAEGITVDAIGNIYIAEYNNNTIRMVNTAGVITTIAGTGTAANSGDGTAATGASLYNPRSVSVDNYGNIYIGVSGAKVRMINASGIISTFAGIGSPGYGGDGSPATAATVCSKITSVFADNAGNVFIADSGRIRKVNASGIISTIAGNGTSGFGGDACSSAAGVIFKTSYLTGDAYGSIYFSTDSNSRIRSVSHNAAPFFLNGHVQGFGVCIGSGGNPLNNILAVYDSNVGQTETYSILRSPSAGALTGVGTTTSTGSIATPTGLYYIPGSSPGVDTFKIRVVDCVGAADTTTVCVRLVYFPSFMTITGPTNVCLGGKISLWDTLGGGNWTSSNPLVALVGSSYPTVTGVSLGSVTITYGAYLSCGTATVTATVNVLSAPVAITASGPACLGYSTTLIDSSAGGTWTSANTSIATVGSSSGVINALTMGATIISYTFPSGCYTTTYLTVNPLPSLPRASGGGPLNVCAGASILLADSVSGGTWNTSSANATLGFFTGVLTGVTVGVAPLVYTSPAGCTRSAIATVNPSPSAIIGTVNICSGTTASLTDTTSGGTWSSSHVAVATVGTAGSISGISAGTATISYISAIGCAALKVVTINPLPSVITGTSILCAAPSTLSDTLTGGIWSTSSPILSIGSSSGIVTGTATGTGTVTYTLPTSCSMTRPVSVSPVPSVITGTAIMCAGSTSTLIDSVAGGSWSSSNGAIATVGSTGVVTGVSGGSATITYTLPTGCTATRAVTINPLPATITGTLNICSGTGTHLSDSTSGGFWSAASSPVASLGSSAIVTGTAVGTLTITYSLPTGCQRMVQVTVSQVPSVITGANHLCVGQTTPLSDSVAGGIWTSDNVIIANIGSSSGIVSGINASSVNMIYTLPSGCAASKTITVNALPFPIVSAAGPSQVCVAATLSLTDPSAGGAWSTAGSAAVVGSTGTVTGLASGIAVISYSLPTGCGTFTTITINANPASITGPSTICFGLTAPFADSSTGGTWGSSNYSVAFIDLSGIVTGTGTGPATISYTNAFGCFKTLPVTVNPAPAAITGPATMCAGVTNILYDAVSGGVWSGGATGIATVGSAGTVTGSSSGVATVSYSTGSTCVATFQVTVNRLPSAIYGTSAACVGGTMILYDTTAGGTWSIPVSGIAATGSAGGLITGIAPGTTLVNYTIGATGCATAITVTVHPSPSTITGTMHVCPAATVTLADTATTGTWSCSAGIPLVASIGSTSGIVTGISPGVTIITYTLPTGCLKTASLTVNPLPSAISGASSICLGLTTTYSDLPLGGLWSRSNTNVIIGSASGILTGMGAGVSVISYTIPATGCYVSKTVTVNNSAGSISGPLHVCRGASITLTNTISGGAWTSSNTTIATIGSSSGILNGIAAGTVSINYSVGGGCNVSVTVTVNPLPPAINGTLHVCAGATTSLTDSTGGGTWATSGFASVGTATGVVTGLSGGMATIVYTLAGTGCATAAIVTINPSPAAMAGPMAVCIGATIHLVETSTGGTWSNSNPIVASLGTATGIVTGGSIGTTTIEYTLPTGCQATATVTVSTSPTAIAGPATVCTGATMTLTDSIGGGLWSSSNPAVATIGSLSGIVTGLTPGGFTTITYSLGTGCTVTHLVSVIALPVAITGPVSLCVGANISLSDSTGGGVWNSPATGTATISSAGIVHGVSAGSAIISYTSASTGCTQTTTITVNPNPGPITGPSSVCVGATIAETDTSAGGVWSESLPGLTIDPAGTITGISTGEPVITYTLGSCAVMRTITVNSVAAITGPMALCTGAIVTLADTSTGGAWSVAPGSVVSIGASSGTITVGALTGAATITYTSGAGCVTTATVTVNGAPLPISGTARVCTGTTTTLTDITTPGSWISGATGIATVDPLSGSVSGIASGVAPITYSLPTGCIVVTIVTVIATPSAVTGAGVVCAGANTHLSDVSPGGFWTCAPASVATTGASGIVSGVAAGVATVSYTVAGCPAIFTVTVIPSPSPVLGTAKVCDALTTALTDTTAGGVWSIASPGIALVDSVSGIVTGVSAGITMVTYTMPNGCMATKLLTANAAPAPITGMLSVCLYSSAPLGDLTGSGIWTSSAPGTASIGSSSGIITGHALGTATISYNSASPSLVGCPAIISVTVNSLPGPISGVFNVCTGATDTLTDLPGGGVWSSSNVLVATIGTANGSVSGIAPGTASIGYSLGIGCTVYTTVTVHPAPPAITGASFVCAGNTTTLHDPAPGGIWSSGATGIASVGSATGVVSGLSGGTANISYTGITGCSSVYPVAVVAVPPIDSAHNLCAYGSTMHVSDSMPGGSWTSALVGISPLGLVTSFAAGPATIYYTLGDGCYASATLTVYPLPAPIVTIGGTDHICMGPALSLSDLTPGGTWSSSNTSVATVGATGTVTTVGGGTTSVIYTIPATGCSQAVALTIDVLPSAGTISGASTLCAGTSITLSDSSTGGSWSCTNAHAAMVAGSTALSVVVTGVTPGLDSIKYSSANACGTVTATKIITITTLPDAGTISGADSICTGASITFSNTVSGGTWSAGNSNATIAATGTVTGVTPGTDTIMYSVSNSCGTNETDLAITISTPPAMPSINGTPIVCTEYPDTLTAVPGGGVWSCVNANATVNAGIVAGVATGVDTIRYSLTNSCGTSTATYGIEIDKCDSNTGVKPLTPKAEPSIWPNPAKDQLTVINAVGSDVIIYDVAGRKVISITCRNNKEITDISGLTNGVYLVELIDPTNGIRVVKKLVKE